MAANKIVVGGKRAPYVVIRAHHAGVFSGYLHELDIPNRTCVLTGWRHLWSWSGAACTAELAQRGPSAPADCRFTAPSTAVRIFNLLEVLATNPASKKAIEAVPNWTFHPSYTGKQVDPEEMGALFSDF
jgi:hypothetical protein